MEWVWCRIQIIYVMWSYFLFLFFFLQSVDYRAMSKSSCYERYCELAVYLQRVELLSLTHEERLAFFINVYNALVIHGYLRLGFPKNMWQRYRVRECFALVLEAHLKHPDLHRNN